MLTSLPHSLFSSYLLDRTALLTMSEAPAANAPKAEGKSFVEQLDKESLDYFK